MHQQCLGFRVFSVWITWKSVLLANIWKMWHYHNSTTVPREISNWPPRKKVEKESKSKYGTFLTSFLLAVINDQLKSPTLFHPTMDIYYALILSKNFFLNNILVSLNSDFQEERKIQYIVIFLISHFNLSMW